MAKKLIGFIKYNPKDWKRGRFVPTPETERSLRDVFNTLKRKTGRPDKPFYVPDSVKESWIIDYSKLLDSAHLVTGDRIFKFCYQPESGEFLCDTPVFDHKSIILNHGICGHFDRYVRGIVFRDKDMIYLRGHSKTSWLRATRNMLYERGVPLKTLIGWGRKFAEQLRDELRGL